MSALNINVMDVDDFVASNGIQEVTSAFINDTSTSNFDINGLFSESIFGEISTEERILRCGYISINTEILHPKMYDIIIKIKRLYKDILSGLEYAIYDNDINDFVKADADNENAETGYSFFVTHVRKLQIPESDAIRKTVKIAIFEKYRDNLFISKYIVLPAGLREYKDNNGRGEYDDINKLYMSLIRSSRALSEVTGRNKMFDPVFTMLQRKANEIYEYINNIIGGKRGYLQRKYGRRNVALGTRNVITATDITSSNVDDDALLKSDEVLIPLFQVLNMMKPQIIYNLKTQFFSQVFSQDSVQASVIDPETLTLSFVSIPMDEKNKFTTSDKIGDMINVFKDAKLKHIPVSVKDAQGKDYYLFLTYTDGENIWIARNYQDLETRLLDTGAVKRIYKNRIKPLTYFEMFYIASYSLMPKCTTITRYPVTGEWSIFPAKIHVASTTSYDSMVLRSILNPDVRAPLPRYPKFGVGSTDGLSPHPSMLAPLNADHDGDTVSCFGIMSEEANKECLAYLDSPRSIIGADGSPSIGLSTDLSKLTLYNLTK